MQLLGHCLEVFGIVGIILGFRTAIRLGYAENAGPTRPGCLFHPGLLLFFLVTSPLRTWKAWVLIVGGCFATAWGVNILGKDALLVR